MANQGVKPSLDGIVRAKPIDGVSNRHVAAPEPRPVPRPQPAAEAPMQPESEPAQPVQAPMAVSPVTSVKQVGEPVQEDFPAAKSGALRKLVKILFVLAVLAILAAGIWWVYISYFA